MKECAQPYFILDGEVRECPSFDDKLVHKGTSVYEVVRLMGVKFLFIEDHLKRLFNSLKMAEIQSRITPAGIKVSLQILLGKNRITEGNVKIVINLQADGSKHFLAYFVDHRYPTPQDYQNGVRVITYPFERIDPNKKIWRPEFRKHVAKTLSDTKAFEVLLMDSGKFITEASKANVFGIQQGNIITPPEAVILPGITRHYVLEVCEALFLKVIRRKISREEIPELDGLFLTGTSLHVLPVCSVDDHSMPAEHHILTDVKKHFQQEIDNYFK